MKIPGSGSVPVKAIFNETGNKMTTKRQKKWPQIYQEEKLQEILEPIPKCSYCGVKTLEQCLKCRVYFCTRKCMLLGFQHHLDDCISIAPHSADPERKPFLSKIRTFAQVTPVINSDELLHYCETKEHQAYQISGTQHRDANFQDNNMGTTPTNLVGNVIKSSHIHHQSDDDADSVGNITFVNCGSSLEVLSVGPHDTLRNSNRPITQDLLKTDGDAIDCKMLKFECDSSVNEDDEVSICKNEDFTFSAPQRNDQNLDGCSSYKIQKHGESSIEGNRNVGPLQNICFKNEGNWNSRRRERCESCSSEEDIFRKNEVVRSHPKRMKFDFPKTSSENLPLCDLSFEAISSCAYDELTSTCCIPESEKSEIRDADGNVLEIIKYNYNNEPAEVRSSSSGFIENVEISDTKGSNENLRSYGQVGGDTIQARLTEVCAVQNGNVRSKPDEITCEENFCPKLASDALIEGDSSLKNLEEEKTSTIETIAQSHEHARMNRPIISQTQNAEKRWNADQKNDKIRWKFLEHRGPAFPPPYEALPKEVKFFYNGKKMQLSENTEEIATFYAPLVGNKVTKNERFNRNFFKDWREAMTVEERKVITDLSKCDFRAIQKYLAKKTSDKEVQKRIKKENAKLYGVCIVDGVMEKLENFKVEPPCILRSRGDNPREGRVKRRVMPEDVIINCSADSKVPVPPEGHKWKEIRHDNKCMWLCCWRSDANECTKYISLSRYSNQRIPREWHKFETARELGNHLEKIRQSYREDFKSRIMHVRQLAVAIYFIDNMVLSCSDRYEKDNENGNVGCCTLRVEHVQLIEEKDGRMYIVVFNFPGRYGIPYCKEVCVEKCVFKNMKIFCQKKEPCDYVFDRIHAKTLGERLHDLMEGLTTSVFKVYNFSSTLQNQLNKLTDSSAATCIKVAQYNEACRAVAIHYKCQQSVKDFAIESEYAASLRMKIDLKKKQFAEAKRRYVQATPRNKMILSKKRRTMNKVENELSKVCRKLDRLENSIINLYSLKRHFFDPRISVAWCKKNEVPVKNIYNKPERRIFQWAIDMTDADFVF